MNNLEYIKEQGLVVIFRGIDIRYIPKLVRAVYDGGARVIEATFNPGDESTEENTAQIIKCIKDCAADDMLVGAGTVIKESYAVTARNAGASFILSPDTNPDIIRLTKTLGMLSVPGAYTPSEIMTAYRSGADIVKLFPITADDINYITNITRPLSHIPFLCTGGVNPDTIGAFFKAGACAVGTGISILRPELIATWNYSAVTELTRLHIDKMNEARICSQK